MVVVISASMVYLNGTITWCMPQSKMLQLLDHNGVCFDVHKSEQLLMSLTDRP